MKKNKDYSKSFGWDPAGYIVRLIGKIVLGLLILTCLAAITPNKKSDIDYANLTLYDILGIDNPFQEYRDRVLKDYK